jgi:hypothetical protein
MPLLALKSYVSPTKYNYVDNIYLIQQFFIPSNAARKREIVETLKNNCNVDKISKIILLNERIYTKAELGLNDKQFLKIQQVNINKRLTYRDVFEYVQTSNLKGYIIFGNSDIFLDKTIENLKVTPLASERTFMAQLRFEYKRAYKYLQQCKLFTEYIAFSQDMWIYHTNWQPATTTIKVFDFQFGIPGCDNKIVYLMNILGYKIINDPYLIRTYHHHETESRTYTVSDRVPPPYAHCFPTLPSDYILDITSFAPQIDIIYKNSDKYNRFDLIGENDRLIASIEKCIAENKHFVMPRITGIENEFSYYIHSKGDTIDIPFLQRTLPIMKRNAGILIQSETSVKEYANRYIDVFKNSTAYFGWEKWGGMYEAYPNSNNYIMDTICGPSKEFIWASILDPFIAIHYKPWTHALKGKKILIISAFVESIQSKIPVREKIYGVDLFPECTFTFLKPPQTQGENPSRDWIEEFAEFMAKVDGVGEFDVALVAAGGYGNLICGEIYKRGRSAIYVGGVLQMYFGIIGKRWENGDPDIFKLYQNEYWTRPMETEKPVGHEMIEGSCYW